MADWIRLVSGRDPIADRRGGYVSTEEYRELLRGEGGFVAACTARAVAAGLRETDVPTAGDVMLVRAPVAMANGRIHRLPIGAICVSETMRAVVSIDRGIVIAGNDALPMIKAWTF